MTESDYIEARKAGMDLHEELNAVAQKWLAEKTEGASADMQWCLAANLEYAIKLVAEQAMRSNNAAGFTERIRAVVDKRVKDAIERWDTTTH